VGDAHARHQSSNHGVRQTAECLSIRKPVKNKTDSVPGSHCPFYWRHRVIIAD